MNTLTAAREHTGVSSGHYQHESISDLVVDPWAAPASPVIEDQLHAIRSGLAGLAGAIHVLTDAGTELPEASRTRLESMVLAEVERLQRLVARPDSAPVAVPGELLDLDRLIEDVVLARTAVGQQVLWSPSGHHVRGHRDELVEVLNILLVNAARHAGTPVRIDVVETAGQVCLSVSDRGPGIPAGSRDQIFERGARRQDSPGQGLGLSIARGLVHDLGGTLTLAPERERGARFEITFPAVSLGGVA